MRQHHPGLLADCTGDVRDCGVHSQDEIESSNQRGGLGKVDQER
jgi:hypothetical protein